MKKLLLLLALLVSPFWASDSGLYYDYNLNGEGILMLVDGERYVTYFFTYGEFQCPVKEPDQDEVENGTPECDLNGQRWFFGTGELDEAGEEVKGVLALAHGIDYPFGVRDPDDPFRNIVGEPEAVGTYILRRHEDGGWRMFVTQTSRTLDKLDPIFGRVFEFRKVLFKVNE